MKLWTRLRFWLRRRCLGADLAEEMRLHREMLVREGAAPPRPDPQQSDALAIRPPSPSRVATSGAGPGSTRFRGICVSRGGYIVRDPMFAAAAILTVAFGVGANTAVVSVLETALLNPLGLRHADRVMVARVTFEKLNMRKAEASGVEFREIQSMTDVFSAAAAMEGRHWTWQSDSAATRLRGGAVTPDFFKLFGEYPSLGRFFTSEDRNSIVLSDGLWKSQFGADPSVIGRVMTLDGKPYHIVGVAPADFRFPAVTEAWTPLIIEPKRLLDSERGNNMSLTVLARLRDGVGQGQAIERVKRHVDALRSVAANLGELSKLDYKIELDSFSYYIAGDLRRPLLLLWGAALLVLITGCANIAGLLLARTSSRRREMAIRISVGATSLQIVRQLLLESLLLGACGGVAGIGMAALAVSLLTHLVIPNGTMFPLVALNGRLLLYGFALALLGGLLFGLAPAIQLLRQTQSSELARSRRRWFQDLFVTAEVAGAFVLVVMTALLLRSLWAIERLQPGFEPRQLTSAFVLRPANDPGFVDRLRLALNSNPTVQSAAVGLQAPFAGEGLTSIFHIRNREQPPSAPPLHGEAFIVTPDYFQTLHIPLLRGRGLSSYDTKDSPLVCVIDSLLANRYFPGEEPIGRKIGIYNGWATIVGIVGAIRGTTLEGGSRPSANYSLSQLPLPTMRSAAVLVRSTRPAGVEIREAVRQTNASVPVYDIKSIEERMGETMGIRRVVAALLLVFGAIGLLLATLGLYGVIAQVVSEQTQEIGIRMALGARPAQILSQFMRQGLRAGIHGLAIGFVAVAYAQKWLAGMLYEVKPFDPLAFASASVGLLSLLLVAVAWPARRASRIDPQQALRHE